jgi:hypothetical protein
MSRVCAIIQWSSEFLCEILLTANKNFANCSWEHLVHDAYVSHIAGKKRIFELFASEYKMRDDALKRVYESYQEIMLSFTVKTTMM